MEKLDLRRLRPREHRLPDERRSAIKESLMQTVRDERSQPAPRRSTRMRRFAGGVAVAFAVAGIGTAAAAAVWPRDRPDPNQVLTVDEQIGGGSPATDMHLDGWRPPLSAERVRCVLTTGATETPASEFPMEQELTRNVIVDECIQGNDLARESDSPNSALVCSRTGAYPQPVVLADGSTCGDHAGLEELTAAHLRELNRLRALDVALLAAPGENGCASVDEAARWTRAVLRQTKRSVIVETFNEGPGCYRGVADWKRGTVLIQAIGPQQHG